MLPNPAGLVTIGSIRGFVSCSISREVVGRVAGEEEEEEERGCPVLQYWLLHQGLPQPVSICER